MGLRDFRPAGTVLRMQSLFGVRRGACLLLLTAAALPVAQAQPKGFIYDEAKVPPYTLPAALQFDDGTPVATAVEWRERRRPEILRLFEQHVYGRSPGRPEKLSFVIREEDKQALNGLATRRQVEIRIGDTPGFHRLDLLIYLPNKRQGPVPAFLGLNFAGNHAIHTDPGILIPRSWMRNDPAQGITENRATEKTRGATRSRWAVESILARGYAVATMYNGDIDPDFDDGFQNGVQPRFYKPGQTKPEPDEWGTVGAWAWGLSRALDYLSTDEDINARRVAVLGHSRLGKAALWAGAQDERFAIVISNNSGCGGAALSKRIFGETVGRINTAFPHWFCGNHKKYSDNEAALPVDQHMLVALIAPRAAYIASAQEDSWADPVGEHLAAVHADPVYKLLGVAGLPDKAFPALNKPVMGTLGYHIRTGKHDVIQYDWEQYLNFADQHYKSAKR